MPCKFLFGLLAGHLQLRACQAWLTCCLLRSSRQPLSELAGVAVTKLQGREALRARWLWGRKETVRGYRHRSLRELEETHIMHLHSAQPRVGAG